VPAISRRTVEPGAYVLTIITIYIPRDRLNRRQLLHGDGASIIPNVPGQRPVQPTFGPDMTTGQLPSNRWKTRHVVGEGRQSENPKKNV
jgi:hypothetical protein